MRAPGPFRRGNDAIARAAERAGVSGEVDFICECSDEACLAAVPLTIAAYREACDRGDTITVSGHEHGRTPAGGYCS